MLNQVVFVGRIISKSILKNIDDDKSVLNIVISVPCSYKNKSGEYDNNYLNVEVWNNVAKSTDEFCKVNDLIGIKGLLSCKDIGGNDIKVVADKITFLSGTQKNEA